MCDDIYRIASEALRNAFRHAGASRIEVHLGYDDQRFELSVLDNGKGIDPKFQGAAGLPGHFGLAGMRERAEQIGGKLTVSSTPESGTEIAFNHTDDTLQRGEKVRLHAARAYESPARGRASWRRRLFRQEPDSAE